MQDFQFYVTDDRYSVPSFSVVVAKDAARAREMAEEMLGNAHYRGVEVWRGERMLFRVGEAVAREGALARAR
jgi:hypothetical protein